VSHAAIAVRQSPLSPSATRAPAAACPLCGGARLVEVERRVRTPLLQNVGFKTPEAAACAPTGTLDLVACLACGLAWNRAFDETQVAYDGTYENDQTLSPSYREHLHDVARRMVRAVPADEPIDALEIGCGQGHLMVALREAAGGRLRSATGFDPAWRGARGLPPEAGIHARSYDAACNDLLPRPPNLVVARHMLDLVADPTAFLAMARAAIPPERSPALFIETPSVSWIVDNRAYFDFIYDRRSVFSAAALRCVIERAGFRPRHLSHVFGAQYLLAEAGLETAGPQDWAPEPALDWAGLATARERFLGHWRGWLAEQRKQGPVALWGAAGKGACFAQIADPGRTTIECLIDVNPAKQGRFIPVTAHPVVSPQQAHDRGVRAICVMNPMYRAEIERMLEAMAFHAVVVEID